MGIFKNFNIDAIKEKTKEIANSETVQKSVNSLKETTEKIKNSESMSKVNEKISDVTNSDTFQSVLDKSTEATNVIRDTSESIIQSENVQKSINKTSEISKKIIDSSKETFNNGKQKLFIILTDVLSVEDVINPKELLSNQEKYDFLYLCKKELNAFDPYFLVLKMGENLGRNFEGLFGETLPYGRSQAFNSKFHSDFDAIAFFPEASKDLIEMKEYGLIINTNSLIIKKEFNNSYSLFGKEIKKSNKQNIEECIYFDQISYVCKKENHLEIEYYNIDNQPKLLKIQDKYIAPQFNQDLADLLSFASHFRHEQFGPVEDNRLLENLPQQNKEVDSGLIGGVHDSLNGKLTKNINNVDFAYHEAKNYKQGAGYFAEYVHSEYLKSPINKVELIGKSNPNQAHGVGDNAADLKVTNRITRKSTNIQLKYKESPSALAKDVMTYDNSVMIPPDKYAETVKILKSKYKMTNAEIKEKVLKGKITYATNCKINESRFGKFAMDTKISLQQSITPATAVALCTGLVCLWQGQNIEDAIKMSIRNGGKAMIISTTFGTAVKTAGRIRVRTLTASGKNQSAQKFASNVGQMITVTMIAANLTPDITNAINGRISKQQLARTLITTGAGLAASTVGGGIASIPIAMVAVDVTSQLYDKYVKDDVLLNYQIYKEVLIDFIYKYQLSDKHIKDIVDRTFGSVDFNQTLLNMQVRFKNFRTAKYSFVSNEIETILNDLLQKCPPDVSEENIRRLSICTAK